MPDITMCMHCDCTIASLCRRNEASGTAPHGRQSWFLPEELGTACTEFWPVSAAAERLAGAMPASLPTSDTPATPLAGVSVNRPIEDLAPGTTVTGTGAPHP